ncbi:MAG: FG-GAP repeat protein [Phycisphaerales bacterium]|nr:FG-GAP repeat protein [Phycisphaerales bacterium]
MPVSAQTINENLKFSATTGPAALSPVATSGTTVIVGDYADSEAASQAGSAYLLNLETGQELFKLIASDADVSDKFGWSVAISGTTAIVGAPFTDDHGNASGSVYLFDTETGLEIAKLTASDASEADLFGWSVAISGTIAIVGAKYDDRNDRGIDDNAGSAYLFDIETGKELFKLTASDTWYQAEFGESVAISETSAIIGVPNDPFNRSGAAYLFDIQTGQEISKLIPSDGNNDSDGFGLSVAISDTTAIVGAQYDRNTTSGGFRITGSAYLFDVQTGQELFKLTASDAAPSDNFGASVAVSGTTAIVGAQQSDHSAFNSGAAYEFDVETGAQNFKLVASDGTESDFFGYSVAIAGRFAVVGAYGGTFDSQSGIERGSIYVVNFQPCFDNPSDFNGNNVLDFFDISAFLAAFTTQVQDADLNNDGLYDFFDINVFLTAFSAGCP